MINVIIADDDEIFRNGLKIIIEQDKDIKVCGLASNGNSAYDLCKTEKPDIVLMDMQMPYCDGSSATYKIKQDFPNIKVLVLTTFDGLPESELFPATRRAITRAAAEIGKEMK